MYRWGGEAWFGALAGEANGNTFDGTGTLFGPCTEVGVGVDDVGDAERVYGHRYTAYAAWKTAVKPDDPARQYRFYRFVPERAKILDEAEFGDAVFVLAEIVRS
jgi:hypothetical protein